MRISDWSSDVCSSDLHWLELVYFEPASLTAVALFLSAYAVWVSVAASVFGAGWVRTGDGFAVLFSLLGALSPLFRDGTGRLRLRVPGSGLAAVDVRPGTLGVVDRKSTRLNSSH